ncbi:MAG: trypsin-like peptidase domain-containing protein, partial [Planctomycetes bacterium]|nr:trypsin-like peptidase domain-containing protein [Planctomycetota bacterium]
MRTFAAFSAALILVICASLSVAQDEEYELQISATVLELKVDTRTHVDMQAGDVDLQGFSVEVPDGTKSVYVNVLDATADIDLMLCDAKLESIDDLDEHSVCEFMTGRVNEVLTYTLDDGLKPGKFVVYAGTLAAYEDEEVSFDILLSFNSKPKLEVPTIPFKAQSELTPLQRAVAASVMLYTEEGAGGSGTVVSPDGLILTNHHVIESESGDSLKQVWVSFVPDARKLPVQTHIANVIMDDAELDLALLQIATDLDGNKIEKPDFVWLALAEAECELGDEIRCLGYPAI